MRFSPQPASFMKKIKVQKIEVGPNGHNDTLKSEKG